MFLRSGTECTLRFDAADYLTLYAVLLFLVPANLIFEPLGALGTPANVVGLVAFGWYVATRMVPSLGIASGPQPLRIAVTGGTISPPIDATLALLGQPRTLARLAKAVA